MTKLEEFRDTFHLSGIDGTRGIEETLRAFVKLVRERAEQTTMLRQYSYDDVGRAFNEIVDELKLEEP